MAVDRQTDKTHTQTRVTTIHFASSTTHAKCNYTAQTGLTGTDSVKLGQKNKN